VNTHESTRTLAAVAVLAAFALASARSSAPQDTPESKRSQDDAPADPLATTEWHQEPVLDKKVGRHVAVYNHADATLETATIAELLDTQYDWLAKYTGIAPRWVIVHVGNRYPCGFTIRNGPDPEMFLQVGSIFDTSANYAHEMQHCFATELGSAIPHWFNESLSDVAWIDSEIELWKRRREAPWLATFDHVDHRSFELVKLRMKYGRDYFRKVYAELAKRKDDCKATFTAATKLDAKNELIVSALSAAAGEDVLPFLKELGFNPRTRERQRGY
jgi:hypothetical protein